MRLVLTCSVAVGALAISFGCGGSPAPAGGPGQESVVASFYPLAFAAEQIGGSRIKVANLTPPGSEPHDLEVSPSDVAEIRVADLVLLLGRDFQPQLEEAAGDGENVVLLLDTPGLALRSNDDPHVWLDPLRYARIVTRIGEALGNEAAARRLVDRLRALDREYRRGLSACQRHDLVTSHEAFGYLAERYGLRQVATTGLSPEAEPEPGKLQQVVDLIRDRGVTTIYFETLVSPRIAETVARETGATTAVLDPIEGLTEAEIAHGDDYFSLMHQNLRALQSGLGCR
jgi:zinc transport system substrate-binding protein